MIPKRYNRSMNTIRNNEHSDRRDKEPVRSDVDDVKDCDSIAQGIAQMEAGEGTTLDEAFDEIRANLGVRQRQS